MAAKELQLLAAAVRFLGGQAPSPLGVKAPSLALPLMERAFPVLSLACTQGPWHGHGPTIQAVCEVRSRAHAGPLASHASG